MGCVHNLSYRRARRRAGSRSRRRIPAAEEARGAHTRRGQSVLARPDSIPRQVHGIQVAGGRGHGEGEGEDRRSR